MDVHDEDWMLSCVLSWTLIKAECRMDADKDWMSSWRIMVAVCCEMLIPGPCSLEDASQRCHRTAHTGLKAINSDRAVNSVGARACDSQERQFVLDGWGAIQNMRCAIIYSHHQLIALAVRP